MYNSESVKKGLAAVARTMKENAAFLSELDAAMGDGDLGIYMQRGFEKAYELIKDSTETPGVILKEAGACIMEEAPSTLGTLMGLFVRSMGREIKDAETFSFEDLIRMIQRGYDEMAKRGKSALGEKTILDSLHPAIEAMKEGLAAGKTDAECVALAHEGAQMGLKHSTSLMAVHGRPAYFGEKTIGMQDGGATVGMLLFESLDRVFSA